MPENRSIQTQRHFLYTDIFWTELRERQRDACIDHILSAVPTRQVYVSIDKDCLQAAYALTNWEEGFLDLDLLLKFLKGSAEKFEILGLDILGDYSFHQTKGSVKTICGALNRPKNYSAKAHSAGEIDAVNEATNIKILETLFAACNGRRNPSKFVQP